MTTASNYSDAGRRPSLIADKERDAVHAPSAEVERLPERDSPLARRPSELRGAQPDINLPRLVLYPRAVDEIAKHAASDMHSEVGGVLLGSASRHAGELFVEVHAALPAETDDHGPSHFTFNADAWSQIHRDRAQHYPDLNIVGWFHTHPGLGIFFSGDDVVVHSAAFVLPWHVAVVVDPLSRRIGCFAWRDGELDTLPGFYEVLESADAPTRLPWALHNGRVWTESYLEHMAARQEREIRRRQQGFILAPIHVLGVAVAGILLTLGLFFFSILPLTAENQSLRGVVSGLADQTILQANADGLASCPHPALRIYAPLPGEQLLLGEEITLLGTAATSDAASYHLEIRPEGEQTWWSLGTFRRPVQTGSFLSWDTSSFAAGAYQLRLSAVDSTGAVLRAPAPCVTRFHLFARVIEP